MTDTKTKDITEELQAAKQKMLDKVRETVRSTKISPLNKATGNVHQEVTEEYYSDDGSYSYEEEPIIIKDEKVPEEPPQPREPIVQTIIETKESMIDNISNDNIEQSSPRPTKIECSHWYVSKGEDKKCQRPTVGEAKYCDRHLDKHRDEPDLIHDSLLSAKVSLYNLEFLTFTTLDKVFTMYDLHKNEGMAEDFKKQKEAYDQVNERLIAFYGEETLFQKLCNPVVTLGIMMTGVVANHMMEEKKKIQNVVS